MTTRAPALVGWRALADAFHAKPDPATAHAPRNRAEFRVAARELSQRGLTARDVAELLHLTVPGVRELLAERVPVGKRRSLSFNDSEKP